MNDAYDNKRTDDEMTERRLFHEATISELEQIAYGGKPGRGHEVLAGMASFMLTVLHEENPYLHPTGDTYEIALEALREHVDEARKLLVNYVPEWARNENG